MKKLLTSLGILSVVWTSSAHALSTSPCEGMTPISTYAARTLERADAGISNAQNEEGSADFGRIVSFWVNNVKTIVLRMVDTDLRVQKQSRNIIDATACLHIDVCLIESKMEEVRKELNSAVERGSVMAIWQLQDLFEFLQSRLSLLIDGAQDPNVQDRSWQAVFLFEQSEPPEQTMCPFDSNYLAPSSSGFGCDLTVLSSYGTGGPHQPTASEYEALEQLVSARETLVENAQLLQTITNELETFLGHEVNTTPIAVPNAPHRRIEGCVEDGSPEQEELAEAAFWPVRGAFSLGKDHLSLIMRLITLQQRWVIDRLLPEYLLYQEELFPDDGQSTLVSFWESFRIAYPRNVYFPKLMRSQATNQSLNTSGTQDAFQQTVQILHELRSPMRALVEAASGRREDDTDLHGLRAFVRDYAFYLRRSCIYRSCNSRLDRILKTVFADECFPYASGEYLEDDEIYQKCLQAAGN